jgi:probable HAF family extracellular repeat protein
MFDVGTFGGDLSFVFALNNTGQAVGFADLAGDANSHAFLWERGNLRDLGTLGGTGSAASWISEAGDIVGQANLVGDQTFHAFSWRNGSMRDLGTVEGDSCSDATSINSRRQIVGDSADCEFNAPHGFFVQGDGPIVNLESLIVRGPEIVALLFTPFISERGEIASLAALPNGDLRVVLLRPTNDRVGDGRDHHSSMSASERARATAIIRGRQKGLHRFGGMPWHK